jgi:hypothetical protein
MAWFSVLPWVLLKCLGLMLLFAAWTVYEPEENRIQSRLEDWWIRVAVTGDAALSRSATFMRESARLMLRAFDRIYGVKFISLRILGVSICFSLASLFLFSLLTVNGHAISLTHPFPFRSLFTSLYFILLGLVPALARWRWMVWFWYFSFAWVLLRLVPFAVFVNQKNHILAIQILAFLVAALAAILVCNALYIALMRWLLRRTARASTISHVYYGVLAVLVCVLMILMLFPMPILLAATLASHYHLAAGSLGAMAVAAGLFAFVLNLLTLLMCLLVMIFGCILLLHGLFWPLLQRSLYMFRRYEIIKQKKWLWGLGFGLLLLTPPQWSWRLVLEALRKLAP